MSSDRQLDFKTLPKDASLAEAFDVFLCNGYSIPSFGIKFVKEHYSSFEARDDDIYVVSFPKTGSTWTQEIVYLLYNNLDFELARSKGSMEKFPYIEHAFTDVSRVINMPSPRLLKSHFPYSLLPPDVLKKKCKMIYVTRNPKDVAVSYYHFACNLRETKYQGTFDQFLERFMADRTTYSPFLRHNIEFWEQRNEPNILFLFYESMKMDLASNVQIIADFLGKSLTSEDIEKVVDHCSFKKMSERDEIPRDKSKNVMEGKFYRKGTVGDWKNYFSDEKSETMDKWCEAVIKNTGLEFTYEM